MIKNILLLAALGLLSSCQTIDVRGQNVDDNQLQVIESKQLSKAEIIDLVGTPTIVPDYSPNTWYYVQRSLARKAWFEPKVVQQRIVKITFDNHDRTSEVTVLNDQNKDNIKVISEFTRAHGTELNTAQKFIKNIGRFNSTSKTKKKKKK